MFRSMLVLVACFAFTGLNLASDKDLPAAKAKAKAKACAMLSIEQPKKVVTVPVDTPVKTDVEKPANRERFVIVSATWCGPCQLMKAHELPALRKAYEVEEVDGDEVKTYGVASYPTVIFERDGKEVWRVAGYTSAETLKSMAAGK